MEKELFNTCRAFRRILIKLLDQVNEKEMNVIPKEFNNNMSWQIAHIITTQGLLCYGVAGEQLPLLSEEFISRSRKGSDPRKMDNRELFNKNDLMLLLMDFVDQLEKDSTRLDGLKYKPYETSSGLVIDGFVQAFSYSNTHDGLHLGNIMALRKVV